MLDLEMKGLKKDFEKYKREFLESQIKGSQGTILKEMQSHFYQKNNLGINKSMNQIEISVRRYMEIGEYGYLYFDLVNREKEEIDPESSTLTSVRRNGTSFVDIKEIKEVIYCDNKPLKSSQLAKCSIAFSLKNFSRKDEKLKVTFQRFGEENVSDVYILNL